jgi:hypothetical protein
MIKQINGILCLLSMALAVNAEGRILKNWTGDQMLKTWKLKVRKDSPALKRYAKAGKLVIEVPDSPGYRRSYLESMISLPKNRNEILKITINLGGKASIAPFSFVAEFRGGKEAGNHLWNILVKSGAILNVDKVIRYVTVPHGASKLFLRLMVPDEARRIVIDSVAVSNVAIEDLKENTANFSVNPDLVSAKPGALHFSCQTVGIFQGLYYGTLPESNKSSKRKDFIKFIDECGIKSVRYPGGTESHFFLAEGVEYTKKILKSCSSHKLIWPRGKITSWNNFRDTMKQAKVKIIYQLNTSFYLNSDDKVSPICPSKYTRKSKLDDGKEHYSAAAAALSRAFEKGIFKPGDVDYWELGNEEFAKMNVRQYASICAAFIKVLKKHDPKTPVCVTGFKGLEKLLRDKGVFKLVTGITTHYPYANWPRPFPSYNTASYNDFSMAWVDFPATLRVRRNKNPDKKISVSETSFFKFFTYDFNRVLPSFAAAMAMARNWPSLISNPQVDMAVLHDLESTYFGMIKYNVEFSNITRQFIWLKQGFRVPAKSKSSKNWYVAPNPNNSKLFYKNQYVISSMAQVLKLMSEFSGGKIFSAKFSRGIKLKGAMAGESVDGRKMIFLANPYEVPVGIKINFPGFKNECEYSSLDTDSYAAVLAKEYRVRRGKIKYNSIQGNLEVILPPRSVLLLKNI